MLLTLDLKREDKLGILEKELWQKKQVTFFFNH
jgi:hypothetical protein